MDAQVSPNSSSSDTEFDEFMDMSLYGKNDNVSCVYFQFLITKFQQYASLFFQEIELFDLRSDFVLPVTFNYLNDPNLHPN